jgi:hypothetical protein
MTKFKFVQQRYYIRFEVFKAVTLKNAVFWDVAPTCSHLLTLVPR